MGDNQNRPNTPKENKGKEDHKSEERNRSYAIRQSNCVHMIAMWFEMGKPEWRFLTEPTHQPR